MNKQNMETFGEMDGEEGLSDSLPFATSSRDYRKE